MYFPTTQWTLLARASLSGETAARQALEELCRRYWGPLHRFIRARGYTDAEAEDLTQEFLLHLLRNATLKKADPDLGRFRSFLLGSLTRFLCDEGDRRRAQKRGRGALHLSIEDEAVEVAMDAGSSGIMFDREWAIVILENALRTLEKEFEAAGGGAQFAVLRRFLPGSLEVPSYDEAAALLNLSLPAMKSELHRLRQRFKILVRHEIASTVGAPHEVDEEMAHLQQVLMDKGNNWAGVSKPLPPLS